MQASRRVKRTVQYHQHHFLEYGPFGSVCSKESSKGRDRGVAAILYVCIMSDVLRRMRHTTSRSPGVTSTDVSQISETVDLGFARFILIILSGSPGCQGGELVASFAPKLS